MAKPQYGVMPRSSEMRRQDRQITEILRSRTVLLDDEERALMRMVLESGQSVRCIARLLGTSPTTISRRIRKIAKRLMDPTYLACVQNKADFNTLELAIIRDHFVRGLSIAAISRKYAVTYYRARTAVHKGRRVIILNTRDGP